MRALREKVIQLGIEWGNRNYINPPYSRSLKDRFVKKAIKESNKGKLCVMLLPVSTSTVLFHDYILPNKKEIRFIRSRIKFGKIDQNGNFFFPKGSSSGTKDSMLVIFDGRE